MPKTHYLVIDNHISEYPEPIAFCKGDLLIVGERYEGPEGWNDWFFCHAGAQKGGWVPSQIIENHNERQSRALADYTAREMNVTKGDVVLGSHLLNGWIWCESRDGSASGWVPLEKLQKQKGKRDP